MGSFFHSIDINEDIMSTKVAKKRHVGGLEAPRNSLEFQMETPYGLYYDRDDILYAHLMSNESSDTDYYVTKAPIKKLISEEISRISNNRQNASSVVARLMGVDMLPIHSEPAPKVVDNIKNENPTGKLMDKKASEKGSVGHGLPTSNCSQQLEANFFGRYLDRYMDQVHSHMKSNRPKPREHPQEQDLQKFKKEFEAWQAARFKDCANFVKVSIAPAQLIVQEDLNREKAYLCTYPKRTTNMEARTEPNDHAEMVDPHELLDSGSCKRENLIPAEGMEYPYSNRSSRTDCRDSLINVVILGPGPDRKDTSEDSWNSTPTTLEERGGGIEDFLEEVKERLKSELQGKCPERGTPIRGAIEAHYGGKPSEPLQTAQEVIDGCRSESTRSYRSEFQLNGTDSPEFINRDTRRLLAETSRNVLRGNTNHQVPMVLRNTPTLSMWDYHGHSGDIWIDNKISCSDRFTNELEKQNRSFRREPDEGGVNHRDLPSRNLIRSLSAPVSKTSLGKLLLDDQHILTRAQIRRKHEVIVKVPLNIKKQKKDKFNIMEMVSSFKYSLTLKGKLFRRRVKSVEGFDQNKNHCLREIRNGPTVMMGFCETHENYTEVPPSPASICSSVEEKLWRQADNLSPASSSGRHQLDKSEMFHVFKEINSNLNVDDDHSSRLYITILDGEELRRKLEQLEGAIPEETIKEEQLTEIEVDVEDQTKAYIRDLLIFAGLFDVSCSQSLSKWNPLGKPISTQVFEEVERIYIQSTKNDERCRIDRGEKVNHKMILDLLNEVLPALLGETVNMSGNMGRYVGPVHKLLCGRKLLLSHVWNVIRVHVHPPADESHSALENVLARDLRATMWSRLMDDDANALGRDIECQIIGELIYEVVNDICTHMYT